MIIKKYYNLAIFKQAENVSIFSEDQDIHQKLSYKLTVTRTNPLPDRLYSPLKILDQKHIITEYNYLSSREKQEFIGKSLGFGQIKTKKISNQSIIICKTLSIINL